jgi:dihydrodipicolinate synthase/N-acetylneuraminate lyase
MSKRLLNLSGAWSAAPTPLTDSLKVDAASVRRMVKHHLRLGHAGMFIAGTCGEGPFLSRKETRRLTSIVTQANNGRMAIAVQVTDNSFSRVLDNIVQAKADGADVAVVAEPWFIGPQTSKTLFLEHYLKIAESSTLPIGIYCRSKAIPFDIYPKVAMHPNVCMFKDSSINEQFKKKLLSIAKKRKSLVLTTGYEFGIGPYLEAGYNGAVAGGGVLIGALIVKMIEAARRGEFNKLPMLQKQIDNILYPAYGGKKIQSWLTGLKYTLVKMGIFSTTAGYLKYPLPEPAKRRIENMIKKEKHVLWP